MDQEKGPGQRAPGIGAGTDSLDRGWGRNKQDLGWDRSRGNGRTGTERTGVGPEQMKPVWDRNREDRNGTGTERTGIEPKQRGYRTGTE